MDWFQLCLHESHWFKEFRPCIYNDWWINSFLYLLLWVILTITFVSGEKMNERCIHNLFYLSENDYITRGKDWNYAGNKLSYKTSWEQSSDLLDIPKNQLHHLIYRLMVESEFKFVHGNFCWNKFLNKGWSPNTVP